MSIATIEAKGIKVKLSGNSYGNVELNQDTLSICRLSKECISNISGSDYSTKLKRSGCVEGGAERTKRHYVHAITSTINNATIITDTTKANSLVSRLNFQEMFRENLN